MGAFGSHSFKICRLVRAHSSEWTDSRDRNIVWRAQSEELEQLFVDRNPTLNSKTLKARYGPFLNQGDILASLKESAVLRILRT